MNAHVLTIVVVDHDEIGADEVKAVLENQRYPNRCIRPSVARVATHDIGEWTDEHPLNYRTTPALRWLADNAPRPEGFEKTTSIERAEVYHAASRCLSTDGRELLRRILNELERAEGMVKGQ